MRPDSSEESKTASTEPAEAKSDQRLIKPYPALIRTMKFRHEHIFETKDYALKLKGK